MRRSITKYVVLSFASALLNVLPVLAQLDQSETLKKLMQDKPTLPNQTVQQPGVALESTIDPNNYFVGPSDEIAVNIWMSPPVSANLTVTPEGTLLIPLVGEVHVSDTTLAEAKRRVLEAVRKKYRTPDISVTLVRPRPIVVTVIGNVLNPGIYTLSAVDRANKVIEQANLPVRTAQKETDLAIILEEMSTRNIALRHKDGSEGRVDIAKFLATKKDIWNPYLREGDVITVPRKNMTKDVIAVYGEVNAPGRYEFVQGDSLLDAVQLAQGFQPLAIQDSVEFSRLDPKGEIQTVQYVDVPAMMAGREQNVPLLPGDRIIVRAKVDLREDYRVLIQGEVLHPGMYPITKNQTRLSEVIRNCGGFTQFASLKGAKLYRHSISPREIDLERALSLRGITSPEDSSYYHVETELRLQREVVDVDFDKVFTAHDSTQDVILQSEDNIVVPGVVRTVYVFGQVQSPGHVEFVPGKKIDYYIDEAGGFIEEARQGDVTIIKASTDQWLSPDETKLESGDYIWVPKKPYRPLPYWTNVISQVGTALGAFVGVALVVATVVHH